jgi:hypothetical protein
MQLHTLDGARKYLTAGERDLFLKAAERRNRGARTFCMTLAYAGCRLSEALALTADRVNLAAGIVVFESLKKRRAGIYRAVPIGGSGPIEPRSGLLVLTSGPGGRARDSARLWCVNADRNLALQHFLCCLHSSCLMHH